MTLAVVAASLGAAPGRAAAQEEADDYFSDDDGSVHEPALDALASRDVLAGIACGEGLICPNEPLKRWEMAVWLVRVLDGTDPAPVDASRFVDVDAEHWSAPFVERLYALKATVGCSTEPARFCPDRNVTRAQMATFLQRAFDLEPAPSAGFTDVSGGSHAANIDALAAVGITIGCSRDPLRYCPANSVTRAQMATFLARALGLIELPASVRFTDIDAGDEHICALRADGTVACWGHNGSGRAVAPPGEFSAVSAGGLHSCGIRADSTVACWGIDNANQTQPPTGEFTAITAGVLHSCGLRADGTIACWGADWDGRTDPPEGQFSAIAAGDSHSCGLRVEGTITCWGADWDGRTDPPEGQFSAIAAGRTHSCGLRVEGTIACWGANWIGQADAPAGDFSTVAVGASHSCGRRVEGTIVCWGSNDSGQADPPVGDFSGLAAGVRLSCGLSIDGLISCWGATRDDPTDAPDGQFRALSTGWAHACGLSTDGSIACWGHQGKGRAYAPNGSFVEVSAGEEHSCGVRTGAATTCWGDNTFGQSNAPSEDFSAVSAGGTHSCGLRADGSVTCWGDNHYGQADAPDGSFDAIAAGRYHSCGVEIDGTVACWGLDGGHLEVPDGQFSAVGAGYEHSCGLRTDGSVVCWGENASGQSDALDGQFSSLGAGFRHSCGLRTDGSVVCWGENASGQSDAPDGQFSAVGAGYEHSCGLRTDGSVVCWGADEIAPPIGVRDASRQERPDPSACRPYGVSGVPTAGFPLPRWAAQSSGTVRVALLFVDFGDAAAAHSTREEAELGFPFAEEYVEAASYGRLDVQFTPLHRWLRAEHGHAHYASGGIDAEAVRLADAEFDFFGYDIVMTVMPSSHFGDGNALGSVKTEEGVIGLTVRVNFLPLEEPRQPYQWGTVAAHEFLHTLGLLDMYPGDSSLHGRPEPPAGEVWIEARFGIMVLRGYFLASTHDQRFEHVWRYLDGYESTAYGHIPDAREMLAWSRWQLGWLDASQVLCVGGAAATVALSPVAADPGSGRAMVAIPLSAHEVVVVESRRKMGYDAGQRHVEPNGASTVVPALVSEGVLVYTVNAALPGGGLPVKVTGDVGNGRVEHYPVLSLGQSVTVRGYTITVVADDGDTHTVTITKADDG